jgi:hypothetical protein
MIETGRKFCFVDEHSNEGGIPGYCRQNAFYRYSLDEPVRSLSIGFIDLSHAANSELFTDIVDAQSSRAITRDG